MEYLQYTWKEDTKNEETGGFKLYYKWNTFNTELSMSLHLYIKSSFKPYYKWNTFNTL